MKVMHSFLRNIDLNLLLVFDVLYRQRKVNEAANELAISPSALSHALSRLRMSLDDPLFIRLDGQMRPTAKAELIAPSITGALASLSASLNTNETFDPATNHQVFRFAVTDYTAAAFFPVFIARLQKLAPNIVTKVVYSSGFDSSDDLLTGKVDFAVGFEEGVAVQRKGIMAIEGFQDEYVVAVRKKHSFIQESLSIEDYLSVGHVVVNPWNEPHGTIDRLLKGLNVKRKIVVELPSLMPAPLIVANTDLAITMPKRAITTLFTATDLAVFPTPFTIPPYRLKVYFNPSYSNTKAHDWMKEQIATASSLDAICPT
ncbi:MULTISPECIES: LysR family transcriptional regulator [Xenorhabdus]|uniref:LysR family transcriptional regulator n=1 Tax=Xenorhabdus TaxID=626 RepID=UPI0006473EB9|nr:MULTISPECIES: LysR family transcriptional regulator [Xenorhabdus]MBC8945698.1 hypothetical protein [Xenorhabdus indica]